MKRPLKPLAQGGGQPQGRLLRLILVFAADQKGKQILKRRRHQRLSHFNFIAVKRLVILGGGGLNHTVFRRIGLNHRPTRLIPPAAAPHRLGQQRKSPLPRPKIAAVQRKVCIQHAGQRDVFKIQSFGDHLRAQQNLGLPGPKGFQQLFMGNALRRGVRVHTDDLYARKFFLKPLLHSLSPKAHHAQRLAALRAFFRHRLGIAAVMAHQPVVAGMIGQSRRAVLALGHMAASHAGRHAAGAPSVEKKHALLAFFQVALQLRRQLGGDAIRLPLAQAAAHIGDDYPRQRRVLIPPGDRKKAIFALFRLKPALHRRGGAAQNQPGLVAHAPVFGDFPGMVAGGGIGFIGPFLLLVDDNQTDILQRGEHRAAGAQRHPSLAAFHSFVFVVPLPCRQPAVEYGHLVWKIPAEAAEQLRRQRDFRRQHNGAAARFQRRLRQADIDLGFAAARHPLEQSRGRRLHRQNALISLPLLFFQKDRRRQLRRSGGNPAEGLLLCAIHQTGANQRPHRGGGSPRQIADLFFRYAVVVGNAAQGLRPLFIAVVFAQGGQRLF